MVWDPIQKVSYTKDLGILAYNDRLDEGDPAKNLFVYGQQDAGYQKLFEPLNTDGNFQKFLQSSTNPANQFWGIMGASTHVDGCFEKDQCTVFMTARRAAADGTLDPGYALLTSVNFNNGVVGEFSNSLGPTGYSGDINKSLGPNAAFQTHSTMPNGSAFDTDPQLGYLGTFFINGHTGGFSNAVPSAFNAVNKSSWFYRLSTVTAPVETAEVDEFDNASHDAYWGLGVNPANGEYILSYTMPSVLTEVTTQAGSLLRLNTDFTANYGNVRLFDVQGDPFAGVASAAIADVSPVPEPATWGLMGLGLAAVAGAARRQQKRAARQ